MPFCSSCGGEIDAGVKFCPKCGQAADGSAAPPEAPPASGGGPTPANVVENENVMGALAYLVIPAIIFLVVEPFNKNRFVRFHSFQAVFYAVASIALQIAITIVSGILAFVGVGFIVGMLGMVVSLGLFVIWIFLLIKAFQGHEYHLPVIGDLAAKQA